MRRALLACFSLAGLSYEAYSAELLYRAANDYKSIASPMKLEMTSSSPTGSRVFSSTAKSGSVKYALEIGEAAQFKVEAYVLAESTTKNAFNISINSAPEQNWEIPVSSTYEWKTLPTIFSAKAGVLEITINGVDAYTRIAGLRIKPLVKEILYRSASDYSSILAPMKLETTSASPTGVRAYTVTNKSGNAKYKFSLSSESNYYMEAFVLAESATKNAFALSVNGQPSQVFDLDTSSAYTWRKFPILQKAQSGELEIEVSGIDAYTRLAALRIVKENSTATIVEVPELGSIVVTPPEPVIPLAVSAIGPASLNEGVAADIVITKTAGKSGSINYRVLRSHSLELVKSGSVTFLESDASKKLSLTIPDDKLYDEKDNQIEILIGENSPILIPFIDNDKPVIPPVAIAGINTNVTNFISPIDGHAKINKTITLDVSSGGFASALQTAIITALPGTRIIIPDGTYTNQALNFGAKACPKGLAQEPIIIQAATPGGVILKGASGFRLCGEYVVIQGLVFTGTSSSTPFKIGDTFGGGYLTCDYCALRNIKIDSYVPENPNTSTTWIQILSQDGIFKTSEGVEVSDSFFNNKVNQGVILYSRGSATGAKHRYYRNFFSRPTPSGSVANGLEAIRIGDSASSHLSGQAIVEHNLFYKTDGDAEIVSLKTNDNIVRFNTFMNSLGALSIRIGHRNVIEGNYILAGNKSGTGGIRMNGTDNIAIGNHIQDGKADGSGHMSAIGMLNAEDIPCATAAYCQVVRPFIIGNFLSHNDSGIVVGAVKRNDRLIAPLDVVISRNIIDTTGTSSSAFVNGNSILDAVLSLNKVLGKTGLSLAEDEVEKLISLDILTKNVHRMPANVEDQKSLRISQDLLKKLGLNDEIRKKVVMENKSIYETSLPLTQADVGIFNSPYKN